MTRKKSIICLLLSLSLISSPFLESCQNNLSSSNSTDYSSKSQEELVSIQLISSSSTLKVGETATLRVLFNPSSITSKEVAYTISDSSIISISENTVTALKEGASDITATVDNLTSIVSITVVSNGEYSYLDADDYASALQETPYSIPSITGQEKYGLSDGSKVGVIASGVEERFPIPADDEFNSNRIISVDDLSLGQIKTYYPEADELNDYYLFQTALDMAEAMSDGNNSIKIKLSNRTMNIDTSLSSSTSKAFSASGLKKVYIEGNNTKFILDVKNVDWKGLIQINDSEDVYLNGFTYDYKVAPSLTGIVLASNEENKTITLSIGNEYIPLAEKAITNNLKIRSWVEYDSLTSAPLQGGNFIVDGISSYTLDKQIDGTYQMIASFTSTISKPKNKSSVSVQFTQYDASGMVFANSKNLYLENITIHHTPGMALTASNITNFYVNRFNLTLKEETNDLMTSTADGIHLNEMHGDCQVTNSIEENSHDDALNIKQGYWYKLTDGEGGLTKQMTVTKITSSMIRTPQVGDKVAVYDEQTFENHNPIQGYYTIASIISSNSNSITFTVNERMSNFTDWGTCRITFISDTPSFVYKNNIVRNKRNRGILVQVPGAVIENNTFQNVGHGSIQAASAIDQYNEATIPQKLSIKNNKFINNCYLTSEPLYGDISIFAIGNNGTVAPASTITGADIDNNFITKNGNSAMCLRGVGETTIKDNFFYDCSRVQPSGDNFNSLFTFYNCDAINLEGNYNSYSLEKGLSGIILLGLTTEKDITLKDNTDIDFQVFSEEGPSVNVKAASGKITIDGNLSDWTDDEKNVDIIAYSTAEGDEVTADSLANHFKINKFKITHDSEGIYLGIDVYDTKLDVKTINDFWLGDCIEVLASTITDIPNADMMVYKNSGGVIQAAFAPTWISSNYCTIANVRTNSEYLGKENQFKVAFTRSDSGYIGEIMLPYSVLPEFKTAVDNSAPICIALVVGDAERSDLGIKRVQAGNVPHFVETYKTKTLMMPKYTFK